MSTRHTARRIAVFNHKGGVGKTTLTVNLAAALAEQGQRVLLIDSDPQCNITSYLFEAAVVDDLLDNSDSADGMTIWSAMKPVVEGEGQPKYVEPYETSQDDLFLVPGDIRLSEYEIELSDYWSACFQSKRRGYTGSTALSRLVNRYAKGLDLDFVFFDTGPNIGPLNRVILLDCDFFIVPGACDLFSVRALKTLGQSLQKWIKHWRTLRDLAPPSAPQLPGEPRFVGYVPQGFRVYGQGMARWPSRYHAQFRKELGKQILTPLRRLSSDLVAVDREEAQLGEVKDFANLVQKAQEQGVALWQVEGGPEYQTAEAEKAFAEMAAELIERTS